jgi:hypothetical protein
VRYRTIAILTGMNVVSGACYLAQPLLSDNWRGLAGFIAVLFLALLPIVQVVYLEYDKRSEDEVDCEMKLLEQKAKEGNGVTHE